jgi:hypothetical protein
MMGLSEPSLPSAVTEASLTLKRHAKHKKIRKQ